MDDKEAKFIRFVERSIPSYINKVKSGAWNSAQASRYFSEQLKKIKNKKKAQELLNLFNSKLREARQKAVSGSPAVTRGALVSPIQPVVIIDGPSSVGPNQSVTLSGGTIDFTEDEGYFWEAEGGVSGVFHGVSDQTEDGSSKSFIIKTSPECENGVLYITAIGSKSGTPGSMTIQVMGARQSEESDGNEENDGNNPDQERLDQEKADSDAAEQKKSQDDQAQNQQKSSWLDWLNKEARKKIIDKLKKKFSKEALAALWKAILPYLPWIILAIVIIVAGIAIMSAIIGDAGTGKAGSTFNKPADPVTDSAAIQKTIMASGDKEAKAKLNNQTFSDIQKQLSQLEASTGTDVSSSNQETKNKIADTSSKIDQYLVNNDPVLGREIITSVKSILESADQQSPIMQAKTRLPLENISGFNWELHYGTPLRKEMPSNESGHSTYMYYGQGKADAVDLYTNKDTLVYPMFDGQVTNISDDGTGHKKIVIKNGDYEILYAHVDLDKNVGEGTGVTRDKTIGKVATISDYSQLHLELSYCGVPVTTTLLDKIEYEQTEGKSWGEYLWNNMKKVLGQ